MSHFHALLGTVGIWLSGLSYSTSWPDVPKQSLRSKYCDGQSAKQCFNGACDKLIEYGVNCSVLSIKNDVLDRLAWCPNFDVCFSDMAYRPVVCRSKPKLCINYACDKVAKFTKNKIKCDKSRDVNYVTDILINCYLPKLRPCLREINAKPLKKQKDQNERKMLRSVECRNPTNKDQCTQFACNFFATRYGVACSTKVIDWIQGRMANCYKKDLLLCFDVKNMPDYTGMQVVSPTICRKNPIQCLPDACSKMQKNYRKDCDDGVFREQLLTSLRK